jgi:hypothetical protein
MTIIEILRRLENLLSPTLLLTLAALSLTAATILWVAAGRKPNKAKTKNQTIDRLSTLQPPEYRGTAYLILSFGWFLLDFVFFAFFRLIGAGTFHFIVLEIADKAIIFLLFFFGLCFLYAGAGDLLRAVTGREGGVIYHLGPRWMVFLEWPKRLAVLVVEDLVIIRLGNYITRGLFKEYPQWRKSMIKSLYTKKKRTMQLSIKALFLAGGIIWALVILAVGILNIFSAGYGWEYLKILASLYPWYDATGKIGDLIIGIVWAFIYGAMSNLIFGLLYNAFVGMPTAPTRTSARKAGPFKDSLSSKS